MINIIESSWIIKGIGINLVTSISNKINNKATKAYCKEKAERTLFIELKPHSKGELLCKSILYEITEDVLTIISLKIKINI